MLGAIVEQHVRNPYGMVKTMVTFGIPWKMEVKKLIHKVNRAEEDNAITISFAPWTKTIALLHKFRF